MRKCRPLVRRTRTGRPLWATASTEPGRQRSPLAVGGAWWGVVVVAGAVAVIGECGGEDGGIADVGQAVSIAGGMGGVGAEGQEGQDGDQGFGAHACEAFPGLVGRRGAPGHAGVWWRVHFFR